MVVKFLSKYILEVIPSIVATVIGAYIVTHYINARATDADKPKAAVSAPAEKADTVLPKAAKIVPAKTESIEKPLEKASETASAPSEPRRSQPVLRDKAIAKTAPLEKATPIEKAAPVEPVAKEDNRDANEMARAAIERLRGSDPAPHPQAEAPRPQSRVSVTYAPPVVAVPAPMPPPQLQAPVASIVAPLPEVNIAPAPQPVARMDDPLRPMPPADIPSHPLDIRKRSAERTSVAEDVVSAAKSVFQAVIPGTN